MNTTSPPSLAFVWQRSLGQRPSGWRHNPRPAQLLRTQHLVEDLGAMGWEGVEVVPPDLIDDEVLLTFHTAPYVQTVEAVSRGEITMLDSESYGLHERQLPSFPAMHEYYRTHVATTLTAARLVAEGQAERVFSPAGGYHLAAPAQARNYCVYNDVVIALKYLLEHGMRVAYVDLDVQHCDVVQAAFAESDAVLTVSAHEGPEFLFPGSGAPDDVGTGDGRGYTVNVPLPPGAGDEHLVWATEQLIVPLLEQFDADLLVTQMGLGMHRCDPVAHLNVTTHGFVSVWQQLRERAPRWVAIGGSGAHLDVAARAWALAFAVMADREDELPEELPQSYRVHWDGTALHDAPSAPLPPEHEAYVWSYVRTRVNTAQRALYPHHGLPQPEKIDPVRREPEPTEVPARRRPDIETETLRSGIKMPKSVMDALAGEDEHSSGDASAADSGSDRGENRKSRGRKRGKGRRGGKGKRGRHRKGNST